MAEHERTRAPAPLRRVVIKEELVALTGDYIGALILNQFLYWSQRTRDFDRFLAEEKSRDPDLAVELTHGWIYKTAPELAEELMLGCSERTIRRHITPLVEAGWLAERRNPRYAWDRTYQYRPDILAIQRDLQALGYALDDYPLPSKAPAELHPPSKCQMDRQNDGPTVKMTDRSDEHGGAVPEITTEITSEITTDPEDGADAPVPPAPRVPASWPEWERELEQTRNPCDTVRWMIVVLYPEQEPPDWGQIGGVARRMGKGRNGYRRLMSLAWEYSRRPPDGDLLPYLLAVHKGKARDLEETRADHTSAEGRRRYVSGAFGDVIQH